MGTGARVMHGTIDTDHMWPRAMKIAVLGMQKSVPYVERLVLIDTAHVAMCLSIVFSSGYAQLSSITTSADSHLSGHMCLCP